MGAKTWALSLATLLMFARGASAAEVRGVLSKIDLDKGELLLEGRGLGVRGTALKFRVDKDTQVLFGRQSGKPSELYLGGRLRVVYETRDNQSVALVIHASGPRPNVPAGGENELTGSVQRVAKDDRQLVLVGPGSRGAETETALAVPEGAKITRGGQAVNLEDLKQAEQVVIRVEKRDGKLTAAAVEVVPAKKDGLDIAKLRQYLKTADQLLQLAEVMGALKR